MERRGPARNGPATRTARATAVSARYAVCTCGAVYESMKLDPCILLGGTMAKGTETEWFDASPDRLFKAAVQTAAALGYSVKHTDPTARVIAFNTGMSFRSWAGQDMSVSVVQGDGAKNGVVVGGNRAQLAGGILGAAQVYDWGEKGKITRDFLSKFREVLPKVAEAIQPETRPREFEAEAVYGGIPYRKDGASIQAFMSGTVVRFSPYEHFVAAASGKTTG